MTENLQKHWYMYAAKNISADTYVFYGVGDETSVLLFIESMV